MHQELLDILICPRCLPRESPLHLDVLERDGDDIVSGSLHCRHCGMGYPIEEGVATLLADGTSNDSYAGEERLSAYLWAHYADLWQDPQALGSYRAWRTWLPEHTEGLQLDLGCAVGRFTFELADNHRMTIGIDRCRDFIRAARQLLRDGEISFNLRSEGFQGEAQRLVRPAAWHAARCEFLVADALALPFPAATFTTLATLNLIDKLPSPRRHLEETSRVASPRGSTLLFADPFSWSPEVADEESWLGGQRQGPFRGPGYAGVEHQLALRSVPPWRLLRHEQVDWRLRNHRNHFEHITSETMLFAR